MLQTGTRISGIAQLLPLQTLLLLAPGCAFCIGQGVLGADTPGFRCPLGWGDWLSWGWCQPWCLPQPGSVWGFRELQSHALVAEALEFRAMCSSGQK